MGEMIRALIVDDEPPSRLSLRLALGCAPGWAVAGECASTFQAREFMERDPVDVVFLDIHMPQESGLQLARSIGTRGDGPVVVFVTAHDQHAVEAFELHAMDYLLKPFDDARLLQALERAALMVKVRREAVYGEALLECMRELQPGAQHLNPAYLTRFVVRGAGQIEAIPVLDVRWILSAGNYVELHLDRRTVLHRIQIGQLERRLDPKTFIRVHRTAIVALAGIRFLRVTGDASHEIELVDGTKLPVSGRYLERVRSVLYLAEGNL